MLDYARLKKAKYKIIKQNIKDKKKKGFCDAKILNNLNLCIVQQ